MVGDDVLYGVLAASSGLRESRPVSAVSDRSRKTLSTPVDDSIVGSELVKQHAGGLPEDLETGMDELEEGGYPRLRINHREGRFVESISDSEFERLDGVVILGFSYSRVMWKPSKPGQGFKQDEMPQCRSNDNQHGQPNTDIEKPALFPWNESVFDPTKAQVNPTYNRVILDCTKCNFQIWGSDGTRPACGLIMTVYVMYQQPGAEQPTTAFLSIKGAGIKPMKKFFRQIRNTGQNAAPYQFTVSLGLDQHTSGDVVYCTPRIEVTGVIPEEYWASLSEQYAQMRDFTKAIIIEAEDKEHAVNGYQPPRAQDPDFFMSVGELKAGVEPNAIGGGRRSAPPPNRRRELASSGAADPLASLMGGHQTIQGTVVNNTQTQQPTQTQTQTQQPTQPAAPVAAPPPQPSAEPVKTEQPSGTPAPTAAATTPPAQSAPAPAPASSGMPLPTMGMPPAVQVAEPVDGPGVAGGDDLPPWASEVPVTPDGFMAPGTDAPTEEPSDSVEGSFPWT